MLSFVSIFGLLASARFAFDPPAAKVIARASRTWGAPDLAAEGYAVLFVRRYLTWNASQPLGASQALAPFTGAQLDPGAGLVLPVAGAETVQWAEAVQVRESSPGVEVYTVAAQTDPGGVRYLTVGVRRVAGGALALAGYPAFVGAPASAPAQDVGRLRPVTDSSLMTVVRRALGNYLGGDSVELAADLAPGAQISVPHVSMQVLSIGHLSWVPGGGSVSVEVQASERSGTRYQLDYELDVARKQGRWEISAIQTNPDD